MPPSKWRRYLENLIIDGNFINKRVRVFVHQTKDVDQKAGLYDDIFLSLLVKFFFQQFPFNI